MAEFYRKKKKICQMCAGKSIDYKDVPIILKYVTEKGFAWAMRNYGNECHGDRECHEHLLNTKGYTRKMFSKDWEFKWGEVM